MARDYTAKVAKWAAGLLDPNEAVQRAVVVNPAGSFMARLNEGDVRVARLAVEARKSAAEIEEKGGTAASIPRRNAYIAVTDRRVVIFGLTKMGRLESILASFGPQEAQLTAEKTSRTNSNLHMAFPDGSAATYIVIQKQDAEALVTAFESLG